MTKFYNGIPINLMFARISKRKFTMTEKTDLIFFLTICTNSSTYIYMRNTRKNFKSRYLSFSKHC